MHRQILLFTLLGICTVQSTTAETQPSNTQRTQCKYQDQAEVTVEYGSVQMKGRKIFGGLVPYGKVWETGYKRSTTLVTSGNLSVGGKTVPAGHYNLVTVPEPERWTLILQKIAGKNSPNKPEEIAGIDLLVKRVPSTVETFAISLDQYRGGCVLNLRWEQTEASVLVAETK